MTYSARITFIKNKLVVEYPDRNILDQGKNCVKFEFLEHVDIVDMNRARVTFLPSNIQGKKMFDMDFPFLIEEQRQFVIFCNSCREKEDLYRAIVNSSTGFKEAVIKTEDCKNEEIKLDSGDRNTTFMDGEKNWQENGETCKCDDHPVSNDGLDFLNSFVRLAFRILKKEEFAKDFVIGKILNKLRNVKNLNKYFPNNILKSVDSGETPLVIKHVDMPYMDNQEGIFLPFKVMYNGVTTIKMLLDREKTEDELNSLTLPEKLKNLVLKNIGLQLEFLFLDGNLILHSINMSSDRMWYGFSSDPSIEMQLFLLIKGKVYRNLVVDKLLQLWVKKLRREFMQSFVFPNMHDIPVKLLEEN